MTIGSIAVRRGGELWKRFGAFGEFTQPRIVARRNDFGQRPLREGLTAGTTK